MHFTPVGLTFCSYDFHRNLYLEEDLFLSSYRDITSCVSMCTSLLSECEGYHSMRKAARFHGFYDSTGCQ